MATFRPRERTCLLNASQRTSTTVLPVELISMEFMLSSSHFLPSDLCHIDAFPDRTPPPFSLLGFRVETIAHQCFEYNKRYDVSQL